MHAVPKLNSALDRDPVPDGDVVLHKDMIANIAVRADARARQNMGKCPNARALANMGTLAESLRMNENTGSSHIRKC